MVWEAEILEEGIEEETGKIWRKSREVVRLLLISKWRKVLIKMSEEEVQTWKLTEKASTVFFKKFIFSEVVI
jgi:hypothetical protein